MKTLHFLTILFVLSGTLLLAVPSASAHLAAIPDPNPATNPTKDRYLCRDHGVLLPHCTVTGDCNFDDFALLFVNAGKFGLGIASLLALFFMLMGAWDLITSGGNAEKIQSGKKALVAAVYGLVIIIAAWVVINSVYSAIAGSTTPFSTSKGAPLNLKSWFEIKSDKGDTQFYTEELKPCIDEETGETKSGVMRIPI